jgi:Family of unknown function (DUF5367)
MYKAEIEAYSNLSRPLQTMEIPALLLDKFAAKHEYARIFVFGEVSTMSRKLLAYGCLLWLVGTIGVRFWGRLLLHPGSAAGTFLLYVLSFVAMAGLARRLCRLAGLPRSEWPSGAVSLALPTLLLDPWSSAFFSTVFPNISPAAAGLFGGWMLCCCAGALTGATIGRVIGTSENKAVAVGLSGYPH